MKKILVLLIVIFSMSAFASDFKQIPKLNRQIPFKYIRLKDLVNVNILTTYNPYKQVGDNCITDGECISGFCKSSVSMLEGSSNYKTTCATSNNTLAIITRQMFLNGLDAFIKWKKEKGMKISIFTLEYILEQPDLFGWINSDNIAEKLKTAIHTIKNNNNIKYFLLIGDTEISDNSKPFYTAEDLENSYSLDKPWNMPTSGYYGGQPKTSSYYQVSINISDLPYSVEQKGYNIWQEHCEPFPDGSSQDPTACAFKFNPSAYVGRWPVRSLDELSNIIDKTINIQMIKEFIFMRYDPFGQSKCLGWPVDESIWFQEVYCYTDTFFSIYNKLFSNIPNTYIYVPNDNQDIAKIAKEFIISMPNDVAFTEEFHGAGYNALSIGENIYLTDSDKYISTFPLFVGHSCYIDNFYARPAAYAEYLIRSKMGPAVFASPFLDYSFYQTLLNGKTIGEAFYPSTSSNTWIRYNPYWLFGDPSLILYKN